MAPHYLCVQCYSCETFQALQKKKCSGKYTCKMCNEKQSLRKIFAMSDEGKSIRDVVQRMNLGRSGVEEKKAARRTLIALNQHDAPEEECPPSSQPYSQQLDPQQYSYGEPESVWEEVEGQRVVGSGGRTTPRQDDSYEPSSGSSADRSDPNIGRYSHSVWQQQDTGQKSIADHPQWQYEEQSYPRQPQQNTGCTLPDSGPVGGEEQACWWEEIEKNEVSNEEEGTYGPPTRCGVSSDSTAERAVDVTRDCSRGNVAYASGDQVGRQPDGRGRWSLYVAEDEESPAVAKHQHAPTQQQLNHDGHTSQRGKSGVGYWNLSNNDVPERAEEGGDHRWQQEGGDHRWQQEGGDHRWQQEGGDHRWQQEGGDHRWQQEGGDHRWQQENGDWREQQCGVAAADRMTKKRRKWYDK